MTRTAVSRLSARIRWPSVQRPDQLSARSASSLFVETVSDAIEGVDCIKFGSLCAELAADSLDVAVDGAVVDIDVVAIGHIEQLVTAFYDTRPLCQRLEDQE